MAALRLSMDLIILGLLSGSAMTAAPKRREEMLPAVARACNRVSLKVFYETAAHNAVLSPVGICTLLMICMRGATDSTLSQIKQTMDLDLTDKKEITNIFSNLYQSFWAAGAVNISSANAVFLNQQYEITEETVRDMKSSFNSSFYTYDPTDKNTVTQAMEDFVAKATGDFLPGRFNPMDLNSDNALHLINTLFFSGKWKDPFEDSQTRPMDFYLNTTTKILVRTMTRTGAYRWNANKKLKCKVLELPYENTRYAMYVILPDERGGLEDLQKVLTPLRSLRLKKLLTNMKKKKKEFDVYLPKFSVTQEIDLKVVLTKLGITRLFDKEASLNHLVKGSSVFVNNAVHKSKIQVTEMGTVAGSYTTFGFFPYSSNPTFLANHPFLFFIRDTNTGFNLFVGKFSGPVTE